MNGTVTVVRQLTPTTLSTKRAAALSLADLSHLQAIISQSVWLLDKMLDRFPPTKVSVYIGLPGAKQSICH